MEFGPSCPNLTTPVGRGTIVFQTEAGNKLQATNVLHVPGLGMNLLSVSQLQNKGYDVYFIGKRVYVKHPSWKKKAQIGVRSNKPYKLQLKSPMAPIGNNDDKDLNEQWHRRMGHIHHGVLRSLKKTVTGVPKLGTKRDDVCRGCVLGKYAKAVYPKSSNRAKSLLGLIYTQTSADQCPLELSVVPNISSPLLMTTPGRLGSTF